MIRIRNIAMNYIKMVVGLCWLQAVLSIRIRIDLALPDQDPGQKNDQNKSSYFQTFKNALGDCVSAHKGNSYAASS